MLTACMLGRTFAIVSFAKALEPWFAEIVATLNFQLPASERLAAPTRSGSNSDCGPF